ncbi:MAG: hypothetical protein Q9206_005067 [Seirophora lacunosa]
MYGTLSKPGVCVTSRRMKDVLQMWFLRGSFLLALGGALVLTRELIESHALTRSVVGAPEPQSFATGFPSRHISPPRTMRRSAKATPWTAARVYLLTSSHPQESAKHRRQFLHRRRNDYTRTFGGLDDLNIAASTTLKPGGLTSHSCLHAQASSSQNKNVSKPRLKRSARTMDTPQTELGFEQCLPPLMQPNTYRGGTRALGLRLALNPSTNFEEI